MPLFTKKKKPSENSKKRLEYQLCLSKEAGADDILDISSCELSEFSQHFPSLMQVFILCGNELRSLVPKGCTITALTTIKVLDLHENKLTSLPDDIGQLTSLQVLNAENNQIKALPETVGDLRNLQTLNVKGNCLSELPLSVGCMSSLRTLDLSENSIRKLPKELASVRTLESLTLDASVMNYPPASVCTAGTEEVQRYLCSELGLEYCPPSQYLLPVLENDDGAQSMDCLDGEHVAWQSKFMDYEKRKEQKQLEKLNFEKVLEEKQREQAQLLLLNNSRKEGMLLSVKLEQERVEKGVCEQQRVQEAERQKLLQRVQKAEASIAARISNLLQEVQANGTVTSFNHQHPSPFRTANIGFLSMFLSSKETLDKKFEQVLTLQQLDKSKAISQILQEEEMQKAAFEALQLQKDSVHGYIRNQIKLIEAELLQLTKLEVKRRSLDAENLQEALAEQRTALTDMLQQLLKQKDQREMELKEILLELELKSDSTQQNYWMIQYQRLLDAKPLSLRMQEAGVDKELVSLLSKLSAQHYLPLIAHHRITAESLCHMTTKDLSKVFQLSPLSSISLCVQTSHPSGSPKMLEAQEAGPSFPSAPQLTPPLTPNTPLTPTAPSPMNGSSTSECVVCMELESQVVFLPCGHVCCCQVCSEALHSCPLCRADISQRVRLYHG
uniref:RING-type domain-containing protein n=1 Tax=Electrophorus electricus TaxID=8005 RepID=A0A4W4G358_ELEEL